MITFGNRKAFAGTFDQRRTVPYSGVNHCAHAGLGHKTVFTFVLRLDQKIQYALGYSVHFQFPFLSQFKEAFHGFLMCANPYLDQPLNSHFIQ